MSSGATFLLVFGAALLVFIAGTVMWAMGSPARDRAKFEAAWLPARQAAWAQGPEVGMACDREYWAEYTRRFPSRGGGGSAAHQEWAQWAGGAQWEADRRKGS